jgi:hypothetical protein
MKTLTIAIDYDETYTAMPDIWDLFMRRCKIAGHRVLVVTMRNEATSGAEVKQAIGHKADDILFTDYKAKEPVVRAAGYKVSIWCDDQPGYIYQDIPR